MENFYRYMRLKTGILIQNDKPIGGKWNFDQDNRKGLPNKIQSPNLDFDNRNELIEEVIELVEKRFGDHFGDIYPFWLEINQKGAEKALQNFMNTSLLNFGEYQDAMKSGEALLFHSGLSSYLNIGFLNPLDVCKQIEKAYFLGKVSIQSAEGFIRQILGWREFIRGIYWLNMPDYKHMNHLNYARSIPSFYWTGDTECACLKQVIQFTKKYAYSHHIQRLMVTGNFATLIGIKPAEICDWYLCVYTDAYEWVELPNTLGMATYADGGIVGTKPYISTGNYINKMSDFCKNCYFNVKEKTGPRACPFNYLYWNFLITHHDKLKYNHRMRIPSSMAEKLENKHEIQSMSEEFIETIELSSAE